MSSDLLPDEDRCYIVPNSQNNLQNQNSQKSCFKSAYTKLTRIPSIPATRFSCVTCSGSLRPKLAIGILSIVLIGSFIGILAPLLLQSPTIQPSFLHDLSAMETASKANKDMMSKLYKAMVAANGDNVNMITSPYSLSSVLALLYGGAGGKTAEELKAGLGGHEAEELWKGYAGVLESITQTDGNYTLDAANRLYVHENFKLLSDYLAKCQEFFKASPETVDFGESEKARGIINGWVEEKTRQKIKDLIPSGLLNSLTRLVLVNAVYFKGDWEDKFDEKATQVEGEFTTADGSVIKTPLMKRSAQYAVNVNKDLGALILSLPYKGSRLFMDVYLSQNPAGFKEMEEKFSTFDFASTELNTTRKEKFDVVLPKFKLETKHDLKDTLKAAGLNDMFDEEKSNFGGMTTKPNELYVSAILQKAFIEVNEEGSEAAAATAGIMMTRMMLITPTFIANR